MNFWLLLNSFPSWNACFHLFNYVVCTSSPRYITRDVPETAHNRQTASKNQIACKKITNESMHGACRMYLDGYTIVCCVH